MRNGGIHRFSLRAKLNKNGRRRSGGACTSAPFERGGAGSWMPFDHVCVDTSAPFERVCADAHTGLTDGQVRARREAGAANDMPKGITPKYSYIFFHNIFTLFNLINFALAALIVLVGHSRNAIFFGVAVCNTFMGIIQEIRSKLTLDKLSILSAGEVRAIRGGSVARLRQEDVVLDDILLLSAGDQVCADAVVLISNGIEVNESLLTGESENVTKESGQTLLSGSFVATGGAYARVTAVGGSSYANALAAEAKSAKKRQTPMMRMIRRIIRVLTVIIIPLGVLLFLTRWREDMAEAVHGSAAAMIGMIPEGLVLLTGVALTIGAMRLARASALVRTLPGIETLARTDVICLDKTGTITDGMLELHGIIPIPVSGFVESEAEEALRETLCALPEDNAVSSAVLRAIGRHSQWPALAAVPFSSERRWSGVCFLDKGSFILGTPRSVMRDDPRVPWDAIELLAREGKRVLCLAHTTEPLQGANLPSGADLLEGTDPPGEAGQSGGAGQPGGTSQLGGANLPVGVNPPNGAGLQSKSILPGGLTAVALIVLSDVLRPEAAETFKFFTDEGVDIKVISGDDPLTVSSIAGKAGIEGSSRYIDMSSAGEPEEFEAETPPENDEYMRLADCYTVFGRASPRQKKALVQALKRSGRTVCMTGDGVNDILAMKEADCSIAMRSGSDATRGVSDFVLMSSDFSAMKKILYEGRRVINNIETVSALYLIRTIYSALLAVIYLFVAAPYPFEPLQVTPINVFTVGIPSFFLTLRGEFSKPEGKFGANILRFSLPAALIIVINIVLIRILGFIFNLLPAEMVLMRIITTGAAGFYALFQLSRPHGKRIILFFAYVAVFSACLLLFMPFLSLDALEPRDTALLIPLLLCIPVLFALIRRLASRVETVFTRKK